MTKKIDGLCFKNMVDYAVRNLDKHREMVNRLNVFPVPDGDTGTNMVTTIHKGLQAVGESLVDLPSVSKKFARSVVYEARGNSGVIVSQFLKGIAERFSEVEAVDGAMFIQALEDGVRYAYQSVADPVEGTMLTVMKDATVAVKRDYQEGQSIEDIIDAFIKHAKVSLENTPELLSVLKDTGVVDSGGAGIVYLFEGMKKYLDGEALEDVQSQAAGPVVDHSAFNRQSVFQFGYCTEFLLQLLDGREAFSQEELSRALSQIGDSLVISADDDKVRVHVHTHQPEKALAIGHRYGEFLSLKIENMTVQHTGLAKKILCAPEKGSGAYAVVAVAGDPGMQQLFIDMGADVAVLGEDNVSAKDLCDAFAMVSAQDILVFPNSADAMLTAIQARDLYPQASVTVVGCRDVAGCYAALPALDLEQTDIQKVVDEVERIISAMYVVCVARREEPLRYGDRHIHRDEYYSFSGKELIAVGKSLADAVDQTLDKVLRKRDREIITLFYGPAVSEERLDAIVRRAETKGILAEFFRVPCQAMAADLMISFE